MANAHKIKMPAKKPSSIAFVLLLSIILAAFWYFQPWMLLTDRYAWYLEMGERHCHYRNLGTALSYADKAQRQYEGWETYDLMARVYIKSLSMADARRALRRLKEFDNHEAQVSYNVLMGNIYALEDNKDKAAEHLYVVLQSEPNNSRANMLMGWILLRQKEPKEALKHLDLAFLHFSKEKKHLVYKSETLALQSIAYQMLEEYEMAEQKAQDANKLFPGAVGGMQAKI